MYRLSSYVITWFRVSRGGVWNCVTEHLGLIDDPRECFVCFLGQGQKLGSTPLRSLQKLIISADFNLVHSN